MRAQGISRCHYDHPTTVEYYKLMGFQVKDKGEWFVDGFTMFFLCFLSFVFLGGCIYTRSEILLLFSMIEWEKEGL